MSPAETSIGLLLLVGLVAMVMRWLQRDPSDADSARPERADAVERALSEASDADPDTAGEMVAISSDGWSFLPEGHGIRLVPPPEGEGHPARLSPGDSIGARVVRGAPDFDPWRLESLGRDHDYHAWFFETHEGAEAALDLFQRRIVRPLRDADGDPVAVTDADFDDARRRDEETEAALDHPDEE